MAVRKTNNLTQMYKNNPLEEQKMQYLSHLSHSNFLGSIYKFIPSHKYQISVFEIHQTMALHRLTNLSGPYLREGCSKSER